MSDTCQIVRRRNGRESVIFDGTPKDAVKFLSDNYPRVHVEPGSPDQPVPDALLKADGKYAAWHGPETGLVETDEDGVPVDVNDDDDDDDDNTATPAKTTAAKKSAAAPKFGGGNK